MGGDGSASNQTEGSAVSEVAARDQSTDQEAGFLLADAGYLGRSDDDQVANCLLQWNGVVQAQLCEGVESCADSLKTGLVKGQLLSGIGSKWSGGVLAADGNIYGIPHNATQVLSVAVVKAAAPVAVVKEHVPGEKVLEANQTSSVHQAKPLT